jgi:aspartate/methionine/tyrosine aminotransferase
MGRALSRNVLTWQAGRAAPAERLLSDRYRALAASHHAMWNYMTYRDAIHLLGLRAEDVYPDGSARLDPEHWADLGWLTNFCGPPASALAAMREAVSVETVNPYTPDLVDPLRDAAAAVLGRVRSERFEVVGTEGAQASISYALAVLIDPGDEVVVADPGYFHLPTAVCAAGGVPLPVRVSSANGYRLDPDEVRSALTARTRAIAVVDPLNPFGTVQTDDELQALLELAEQHDLVLLNDLTHAAIRIDPGAEHHPLLSLAEVPVCDRVVGIFSVSHCFGMAGARLGFLGAAPELARACLRAKAALVRLNTNLVSQHGALAALRDPAFLEASAEVVRRNLTRLESIAEATPGVTLPVRPSHGFSAVLDVAGTGASAQELTVALFARRVAVYPGDGLGDVGALRFVRLNLSRPDGAALERLAQALPDAIDEAASGRWREPVADLLASRGSDRGRRLAGLIRQGRLDD